MSGWRYPLGWPLIASLFKLAPNLLQFLPSDRYFIENVANAIADNEKACVRFWSCRVEKTGLSLVNVYL